MMKEDKYFAYFEAFRFVAGYMMQSDKEVAKRLFQVAYDLYGVLPSEITAKELDLKIK